MIICVKWWFIDEYGYYHWDTGINAWMENFVGVGIFKCPDREFCGQNQCTQEVFIKLRNMANPATPNELLERMYG